MLPFAEKETFLKKLTSWEIEPAACFSAGKTHENLEITKPNDWRPDCFSTKNTILDSRIPGFQGLSHGLCDVKNRQKALFGNTSPPPQPRQKKNLYGIILLKCIVILSHQFLFTLLPSTSIPPWPPNQPQPPLQVFMQLLQQIDDLLPLFHGATPSGLPISWLNLLMMSPLPLLGVKKLVRLVMYGFFNGLWLINLDRCWFVQNKIFVWKRQHTGRDSYMVNSEFTIMTGFVWKPNMLSSSCFSQNICSELPQSPLKVALKFGVL